MKKKIAILGSTGSIGKCLIDIISQNKKNYKIVLLSTNTKYKDLFHQAKQFNVKNLIIKDPLIFNKIIKSKKNKKINIFNTYECFNKIFIKKIDYTMNAIVGIEGLYPTLKIIKYTKKIAIANKESIICGWNLIQRELHKYNTDFIPVDSEHFSIWFSMNLSIAYVEKIYITASGGPFNKKLFKNLNKINISQAINHPTWKMGKKISIDSATLINKVFEIIEAKKIFNISYDKLEILVHPQSYIHAIIKFNNGIIKLIAHDTTMKIPIFNSLQNLDRIKLEKSEVDLTKLNSLDLSMVNKKVFPIIEIINELPDNDTLFETVIVSANDYLVNLFLNKKIKFTDIVVIMLKIVKMRVFARFKKNKPTKNNDILKTRDYTIKKIDNLLHYEKF